MNYTTYKVGESSSAATNGSTVSSSVPASLPFLQSFVEDQSTICPTSAPLPSCNPTSHVRRRRRGRTTGYADLSPSTISSTSEPSNIGLLPTFASVSHRRSTRRRVSTPVVSPPNVVGFTVPLSGPCPQNRRPRGRPRPLQQQPSISGDVMFGISLPAYVDCGDAIYTCSKCNAFFWYAERVIRDSTVSNPVYKQCCKLGAVFLSLPLDPPPLLAALFADTRFMDNIRAYNSMFAMTSFGAKIDDSLNIGHGPYIFKISGQIYHWIGSLCPAASDAPRFLQLYIYDTENEVDNRLRFFPSDASTALDRNNVLLINNLLHSCNEYVRLFKTSHDIATELNLDDYSVRLYANVSTHHGAPPRPGTLGAIVFGTDSGGNDFDIVLHSREDHPRRINKLHPSYMPLQYPLLFPFGEDGWTPTLRLRTLTGELGDKLTANMYYSFLIHDRCGSQTLLMQSGRLFQQFLVDSYVCVEQERLDYIRTHQNKFRTDYVSGVRDAISCGDSEGHVIGKRMFLPSSFVGGPRYMYQHYQVTLAICRSYGNPQYFITFTCNVGWPEIQRHVQRSGIQKAQNRPDIIARVFQMKVSEFISFLKQDKTFGVVSGFLYTIEFQKRGLPHCHTLLWVTPPSRIVQDSDIDRYISAELSDPITTPTLYKTVTSCMFHGPCGLLNPTAPCMQNGKCKKRFPKPFSSHTSIDKDGYVSLVGPGSDLGVVLGHARTGAERHLVEHLACDQNDPDLQIAIPASFLHQIRRGLFLSARNQEGYKSPKAISRKTERKVTDLEMAAIGGGCDGVGPDSGVVRPCSWSGFGRGSEGVRMVCLIPTEVAEFGVSATGGGCRRGFDRGVEMNITPLADFDLESRFVFPETSTVVARWSPAATVVAGGGSRTSLTFGLQFLRLSQYVHYKRDCHATFQSSTGVVIDNGYIVPYNPRLSSRFDAHINVEYCGWNMLIKYIFKYVSKGVDRISFAIRRSERLSADPSRTNAVTVDEVENFVEGRFVCPHEASWRLFNFPIHQRWPAVQILAVHLQDMQSTVFEDTSNLHHVIRHPKFGKTTLTAWFETNKIDSIGRCVSFSDIRTVHERIYPTFRNACAALGLLGDDREWLDAFKDASVWASSIQLRYLFCHLLLFCNVTDPMVLWSCSWRRMGDDICHALSSGRSMGSSLSEELLQNQILLELEKILHDSTPSKKLTDFHLPTPTQRFSNILDNRLLMEERNYDTIQLHQQYLDMYTRLNVEQKNIFDKVASSASSKTQILLFVYGHGGTGKTFLWSIILAYLRSKDTCMCHVKKRTHLAELMRETSFVIWDEATMNDRKCFECVDRTFKDILEKPHLPFGGMSMLVGGDFRQTLPVKPKVSCREIIASTLPNSVLWRHFTVCPLVYNMRLSQTDSADPSIVSRQQFASWILDVGNGVIGSPAVEDPENMYDVVIPPHLLVPLGPNQLQHLIDFVYPLELLQQPNLLSFSNRAIVCPKNITADAINTLILSRTVGVKKHYLSVDSISAHTYRTCDTDLLYPPEYLNQLTFQGLPLHDLSLTVNCPVLLMRNFDQSLGLCNGTRLLITRLLPYIIEATILTGTSVGKRAYIPKMKLVHNSPDLPFVFTRKQFPLKVCYAMTINKSQGQSLDRVGICLPEPVFSHGQLYVALSRATTPDGIRVLVLDKDGCPSNKTKNVVFNLSSMSRISDLTSGCAGEKLEIRILRRWVPRFRSYEMWYVGVDKFGDCIQILSFNNSQGFADSKFKLQGCYSIETYTCTETERHQRLFPNPLNINVGRVSKILELNDDKAIPTYWFSFATLDLLQASIDRNDQFPDVIGYFRRCESLKTKYEDTFIKMEFLHESGKVLPTSLWKECVTVPEKFPPSIATSLPPNTVIAITNVKVSKYSGELSLSSTSATHVIVRPECPEAVPLQERSETGNIPDALASMTTISISELKALSYNAKFGKTFFVTATITSYNTSSSWYTAYCPSCKKSIVLRGDEWFCVIDGKQAAPKFCFLTSATIDDGITSLPLTLSDEAMKVLAGMTCEEVLKESGSTDGKRIPWSFDKFKNHAYGFHVQLSRQSTSSKSFYTCTGVSLAKCKPSSPILSPSPTSISIPTAETPGSTSSITNEPQSTSITATGKRLMFGNDDINPSKRERCPD
ncbi:hypothetical protein LXL04_015388 [Taraxacum kok-saghyz]